MNGWVVLLWSTAAALVLIVAGIFVTLVIIGRIDLFPQAQPDAAATPAIEAAVDPSYRVLILNGTAEDGIESDARQILLDNGWTDDMVLASAGSTTDFETTTVYYVETEDLAAAEGVADLLGGATLVQSDFYAAQNTSEDPQLTVVLGLDRTTAAPETPSE